MAEAPRIARSASLAAAVGAAMGVAVYGLIHGLPAFDLTQATGVADLMLHGLAGAALFMVGATIRNVLAPR